MADCQKQPRDMELDVAGGISYVFIKNMVSKGTVSEVNFRANPGTMTDAWVHGNIIVSIVSQFEGYVTSLPW